MRTLAIVLLIAACGGGSNSGAVDAANQPADAKIYMDAPPSVPAMITISGIANDNTGATSSMPVAGVTVSLLKTSDDSMLGTATSGADGKYSFSVTTGGHVVDAYILATKSGYADAAAFPAKPWEGDDTKADSNLITTGNYSGLVFISGQAPDGSKGFVVAAILDASGNPVAGAKILSSPAAGAYKYMDSNNTPTATTSTNTDGASFLVNVPPGMVSISATKTGMTFKTHSIKARANTFTATVITQ